MSRSPSTSLEPRNNWRRLYALPDLDSVVCYVEFICNQVFLDLGKNPKTLKDYHIPLTITATGEERLVALVDCLHQLLQSII